MTRLRVILLFALLALPVSAAPVPAPTPAPSTTPKRYKIGDTDQKHSTTILQRIEDTLPVALLIFLGIRSGHVEIGGSTK